MNTVNQVKTFAGVKKLSYSDIQFEEGVYIASDEYKNSRLVVVKLNDKVCVLYVGADRVEPANEGYWGLKYFTKTEETFSCSIK